MDSDLALNRTNWFSECLTLEEKDNDVIEDDDNLSNASTNISDHSSDSEFSCDDIDIQLSHPKDIYLGKDKQTEWQKTPPPRVGRNKRANITTVLPGVKKRALGCKRPIECWLLFFTDEDIELIVKYTNIRLEQIKKTYTRERDCLDTTVTEMKALFGLLYFIGSLKMGNTNAKSLWQTDGTAPEYCRLVMRYNRFYMLLRALRFDDVNTRQERRKNDKLAPIRELFEKFNEHCFDSYSIGQYFAVDEMLEPFRGRCSFKQYLPSKPNKYGIKIFAAVDSRTYYTGKLEIYPGKQPDGPFQKENKPSSIVKRIAEPFLNAGRNVTFDNWFSSIPLVEELVTKYRTTSVATVRKNKREIPPEFLITKKEQVFSSKFAFRQNCTLVSYISKKNKNVLLLSSMHKTNDIDLNSGEKKKPEIVTFYYMTMGAVDVVDQMKSTYSVGRYSCRWPLTVFFGLLNVAGINSQIIYRDNNNNIIRRSDYLRSLAKQLIEPFLLERVSIRTLPTNIRDGIYRVMKLPKPEPEVVTGARQRCNFCPVRKNRFTKNMCSNCSSHICGEHTIHICTKCYSVESEEDC